MASDLDHVCGLMNLDKKQLAKVIQHVAAGGGMFPGLCFIFARRQGCGRARDEKQERDV